jgi:hypothetical protein
LQKCKPYGRQQRQGRKETGKIIQIKAVNERKDAAAQGKSGPDATLSTGKTAYRAKPLSHCFTGVFYVFPV